MYTKQFSKPRHALPVFPFDSQTLLPFSTSSCQVLLQVRLRSLVRSQQQNSRNGTSTIHDNDPHTLELEKQRNLANKQHATSTPISEARGWNEFLATTSEAYVKVGRTYQSPHTFNPNGSIPGGPVQRSIDFPRLKDGPIHPVATQPR